MHKPPKLSKETSLLEYLLELLYNRIKQMFKSTYQKGGKPFVYFKEKVVSPNIKLLFHLISFAYNSLSLLCFLYTDVESIWIHQLYFLIHVAETNFSPK